MQTLIGISSTASPERLLRRHYLFCDLSDAQWTALRRHVRRLRLPAGATVFERGRRADAFFVLACGSIKLFRESAAGTEKIMRMPKIGQSFADSILFADPPAYPVHARTLSECVIFRIEREAYLAMLRESFATCRAVMAQMTRRLYANWDEIEALSLYDSHARVARYLLDLARAQADATIRLPMRKTLIAGQLGLAPETLSRGLRALTELGAIAVHGRTVEVLDRSRLWRSAGR